VTVSEKYGTKKALTAPFFINNVIDDNYTKECEMEMLQFVADVGFPIASALAGGFFVFLTLKFILDGVLGDIKTQRGFAQALDNRIKTMNNEVVRIDVSVCHAFGISPDLDRISRADGQQDARKD
jgi:archaellum biogenesis ATPase FlaH